MPSNRSQPHQGLLRSCQVLLLTLNGEEGGLRLSEPALQEIAGQLLLLNHEPALLEESSLLLWLRSQRLRREHLAAGLGREPTHALQMPALHSDGGVVGGGGSTSQ